MGQHGAVKVRQGARDADVALVINWPVEPGGSRRAGGWRRHLYKLAHRPTTPLRVRRGYEWLNRPRETTFALLYEPPPLLPDWLFEITKAHCARVYAPDPRATHPITLPSMWTFEDDVRALRALPPPEKPVPLAAINAGRPPGKNLIEGHVARLAFFCALRAAGIPLELFGRGLPTDLKPGGFLASKASALRPARFALCIENYDRGEHYVTEKLWDALACWCLPLYHGSSAPDRLIPPEAFVRLPDLKEAGLNTVRRALSDPDLWNRSLGAIAEARRRALGELRIVEWARREFPGLG